jgi:hypothetical protein
MKWAEDRQHRQHGPPNPLIPQGTGAPDLPTMNADADDRAGSADDPAASIVGTNASFSAPADDADDADDGLQDFSGGWGMRI